MLAVLQFFWSGFSGAAAVVVPPGQFLITIGDEEHEIEVGDEPFLITIGEGNETEIV